MITTTKTETKMNKNNTMKQYNQTKLPNLQLKIHKYIINKYNKIYKLITNIHTNYNSIPMIHKLKTLKTFLAELHWNLTITICISSLPTKYLYRI